MSYNHIFFLFINKLSRQSLNHFVQPSDVFAKLVTVMKACIFFDFFAFCINCFCFVRSRLTYKNTSVIISYLKILLLTNELSLLSKYLKKKEIDSVDK